MSVRKDFWRSLLRTCLSRARFWAGSPQTVSSRIALIYVGRCKETMASLVQSWPNRDDCSPQTVTCLERETEAGAGSGPEQMSSHGSQRKGICASQAGRSPKGCWGGQTMPKWAALWVHWAHKNVFFVLFHQYIYESFSLIGTQDHSQIEKASLAELFPLLRLWC